MFFWKRRERPVVEPYLEIDEQLLASFPEWDEESLEKAKKVQTLEQAREAYNSSRIGSEGMGLSLKTWEMFSEEEVDRAKTYSEAYAAYCRSPKGTVAMLMALRKMVLLHDDSDRGLK